MSPLELILNMVGIGIQVLGSTIKGNPTNLEEAILKMVQQGHAAYKAQTGKEIDPSTIKPIEHV